jgi:thiosulfate/3-mercaptopyruvate sulfurtransferase
MRKKNLLSAVLFLSMAVLIFAQAKPFTRSLPAVISTEELGKLMATGAKVVIVDCRAPDMYAIAHIKGAINIYTRSVYDKKSSIENMMPSVEELAALFGQNGIARDQRVVVYEDSSDARDAARMFLYLESAGNSKTQILDGGIAKWSKEKREKSQDLPKPSAVSFVPQSQVDRFIVSKQYVLENLKNPKVVLVDDRSADEYTGKILGTNVKRGGGHIPGAINKDYKTAVKEDGTFKDVATLRKEMAALGISADKQVVFYCRTAARSSLSRIVYLYLLGLPNVKVYDGSMVEWSADESLPLER